MQCSAERRTHFGSQRDFRSGSRPLSRSELSDAALLRHIRRQPCLLDHVSEPAVHAARDGRGGPEVQHACAAIYISTAVHDRTAVHQYRMQYSVGQPHTRARAGRCRPHRVGSKAPTDVGAGHTQPELVRSLVRQAVIHHLHACKHTRACRLCMGPGRARLTSPLPCASAASCWRRWRRWRRWRASPHTSALTRQRPRAGPAGMAAGSAA